MTKTLIAAILLSASVAAADSNESADAALARGQAALKAGRVHEACDAFEIASQRDPQIETELKLASCYAQDGKPVTAARLYRTIAEKDTNASRKQTSLAKAGKLETNAPKLRFAINPNPAGLVIKVDGVEVPSTGDVQVDLGPHEVTATAPGYAGHASAPVDREKIIVDVILRMEEVAQPAPMTKEEGAKVPTPEAQAEKMEAKEAGAPMAMTDETPRSHRKRNGIILAGGGAALIVTAAVLWKLSADKFDDEHALCPMSRCANDDDLAKAKSLLSDGRALRGTSYGVGIGGLALLGAGGYLLMTPSKREGRVAIQLQPNAAGVGYTARF